MSAVKPLAAAPEPAPHRLERALGRTFQSTQPPRKQRPDSVRTLVRVELRVLNPFWGGLEWGAGYTTPEKPDQETWIRAASFRLWLRSARELKAPATWLMSRTRRKPSRRTRGRRAWRGCWRRWSAQGRTSAPNAARPFPRNGARCCLRPGPAWSVKPCWSGRGGAANKQTRINPCGLR